MIDVAADMSGFNNKEIRVKAGEPVTMRLTSPDNSHHTDGGGALWAALAQVLLSIVRLTPFPHSHALRM